MSLAKSAVKLALRYCRVFIVFFESKCLVYNSGLYAAGRNAVGICSNSYVSGLSLSDCIFSGRRAGRHAAAQAQNARGVAAEIDAE